MPVIYAYDGDAFYVATIEGQKVRMMRENPEVCFEVDEYEAGSWRSAIVQGDYEELEGADADRAIALLATRFGRTPREGGERPVTAADGASTVCFRIRIRNVKEREVRR